MADSTKGSGKMENNMEKVSWLIKKGKNKRLNGLKAKELKLSLETSLTMIYDKK